MAEAIIRGLVSAGVEPERIFAFDPSAERLEYLKRELDIEIAESNRGVGASADIVVFAVKPYVLPDVLADIGSAVQADKLVISIVAGVTTARIEAGFDAKVPVVRIMPNTPCLIGEGISAIAPGGFASTEDLDMAEVIFSAIGRVVRVSEDKLDAVTGLSGSGPAYVYMFIEALADGGVRMGLPRDTALLLAAQTVAGSAQMVLKTGTHPAVLKDRVTTPGGTTIEGIVAFEDGGLRSAAIEAVSAAARRSTELGKR